MSASAPSLSWRQRLGMRLLGGERGATQAIPFLPSSSEEFGPGIGNQPSHEALLQNSLGIADTSTRAIANRVSGLNPQVKTTRRVMDGTTEDEIIDDHVLKDLLERPHPNYTRAQLFRLTAQWIVTVGEAYWLKVGNGLGVPTELHPMPPGKVTPLVRGGVVTGYKIRSGNGGIRTVPADVVCRFFFPDPENPWAAEGYLAPEGVTADSLRFAGQHLRKHFEHDGTPKNVLETSPEAIAFTQTQADRFNVEWIKKYHSRFGTNKGAPAILPVGYKLVQLAMRSGADITPLLEYWRDEQLMGFGVPRSLLGQVVSGDRSSAETNQWVFDKYAVTPIADLIADGLTLQLAPDFDPSIFVEFEEFVSADKEFELKRQESELKLKVRSINQVREDDGLDPVDWGEQPVGTIADQPYDPNAAPEPFEMDVPGALGGEEEPEDDEDEDERVLPAVRRKRLQRDFFTPANEWERQIRREKKFVPAFLRAMRSIFRDQMNSVLEKLRASEPRARVEVEDIFDPEEWARLFEVRVEPIRVASFTEILFETLEGLGVPEAFNYSESMQKTMREQGAQLVSHANKTTQKRIAEQLVKGTAEGEGVEAIAARIESVFNTRRKEARTIARTEILKASQTAQLEGFDASGVVEGKRWNTNRDDAVRDSHAFAEGQTVPAGEPFDLAGEYADAPGVGAFGASLSAANTINCRCFVTPVRDMG